MMLVPAMIVVALAGQADAATAGRVKETAYARVARAQAIAREAVIHAAVLASNAVSEPPEVIKRRDMVWTAAHLQFENGGESVALIPTRYPGSESAGDGLIALARKTVWEEMGPDTHRGLGQRILATDTDDTPIMEVRTISLTGSAEETAEPAGDHG